MHIIKHKTIIEYAQQHPNSASALDKWYRTMKAAQFENFPDMRKVFPATDIIKGQKDTYEFNIGGNTARLRAKVYFTWKKVYILAIRTHAEYTKE